MKTFTCLAVLSALLFSLVAAGGPVIRDSKDVETDISWKKDKDESIEKIKGKPALVGARIDLGEGVSGMIGWVEGGKRKWIQGDSANYGPKFQRFYDTPGSYLLFEHGPRDFKLKAKNQVLLCTLYGDLQGYIDMRKHFDPRSASFIDESMKGVAAVFPFKGLPDGTIQQDWCLCNRNMHVECYDEKERHKRPVCGNDAREEARKEDKEKYGNQVGRCPKQTSFNT